MKSIINAEEFYSALKKAFLSSAKKSQIPGLMNAQISFQGNKCVVTCTDFNQWCQITIPACGDTFSFQLKNTKRTLTICNHYSGDLIVEYAASGCDSQHGTLTFQCGGKTCTQEAAEADDALNPPEVEEMHTYQADADALFQRYKRIKYALSDNSARPTGQCVQFQDSRMVAVDGYRLAVSRDPALHVEGVFFIPPGAMNLLPVLGNTSCTLLVGEKHIAFAANGVRIVTRIPKGDGLNVDAVIPKTSQEEHTVNVDTFIHDLQYLSEFITAPESQAVRFAEKTMSLSTPVGQCSVALELQQPLKTVCGFNGRYMLEGLKQFNAKKAHSITMGLSSPVAPILLTDGDGDLAMVLPMRLKDGASAA
jgi:DNA polymerase III sliding clamp (beta) subunit (PCNA family)